MVSFRLGVLSSNGLPSSTSLSPGTPDVATLLHTSETTPEIDGWRSSIPARVKDDKHSRYAESIASEASSRATSRLSSHTDDHAAVQHSAYTSGQGVYATHSGSSLSLASHAPPSSRQPNRRTRELLRLPPSQGYSYTPHTSLQDRPSPISPVSVPSRRNAASPTSSIHSRSLPVPPTLLSTKPPIPPLPIVPNRSSPASPDPGLALRHHLTHLHHDHDPTPIFGVFPPSPSRNMATTHRLNCHQITPRARTIYSLYQLRPGTRPNTQVWADL
ncbi:hypothetical protein EDB84DRAFT_519970 [Lactarius hengduanensis]|nr:hypothetical protein EDB84DRAFT_519970 [Lactarius hengduanensis]